MILVRVEIPGLARDGEWLAAGRCPLRLELVEQAHLSCPVEVLCCPPMPGLLARLCELTSYTCPPAHSFVLTGCTPPLAENNPYPAIIQCDMSRSGASGGSAASVLNGRPGNPCFSSFRKYKDEPWMSSLRTGDFLPYSGPCPGMEICLRLLCWTDTCLGPSVMSHCVHGASR